ncbi:MAG: hypothetical protein ABIH26_09695, partial [Candidatus Eisenbacteria bacterium]
MRTTAHISLCWAVILIAVSPALGDAPRLINYQGTLTDSEGALVSGPHDLTFTMYPDSSGSAVYWQETRLDVSVDQGLFNVILGSLEVFPDSLFGFEELWMGVKVDDDPEIQPRMRVTSVPWALIASLADSAGVVHWNDVSSMPAGFADGIDDVGGTDTDWTISGDDMYSGVSGNVGIGTTSPGAKLHAVGSAGHYGQMGLGSYGVYGAHSSGNYGYIGASSRGVFGYCGATDGVFGQTTTGTGVRGYSSGTGLGLVGHSVNGSGVYGYSNNSYAGYFNGNVWLSGLEMPTGASEGFVLTCDSAGIASWAAVTTAIETVFTEILTVDGDASIAGSLLVGTAPVKDGETERGSWKIEAVHDDSRNYARLGGSSMGIKGYHYSTGNYGWIADSFAGVGGYASSGSGVMGLSGTGYGMDGQATSGIGVKGSATTGTGVRASASLSGGIALRAWASGGPSGSQTAVQVEQGYGDWIKLAVNEIGDTYMLHNPMTQDRLSFGVYDALTDQHYWDVIAITDDGKVGIGTGTPTEQLEVIGTTRTDVLEIAGGSDLAEPFPISGNETVMEGAVVVIDEENPGRLKLSDRGYDRRVAGVVSGAGGLNPGLTLSQRGVTDEGRNVALSGRVYAWADASNGPIGPGDLLTTSSTPGHVMKVTDYDRAHGAVIGKAMSSLESGRGLVLVLVNL